MNDHEFYNTNFSVVTYSGTKEPFCGIDVFPPDQELSFTNNNDHREFCGIKLDNKTPTTTSF